MEILNDSVIIVGHTNSVACANLLNHCAENAVLAVNSTHDTLSVVTCSDSLVCLPSCDRYIGIPTPS